MGLVFPFINSFILGLIFYKLKEKKINPFSQWWFWLISLAFFYYSIKAIVLKLVSINSITFPPHVIPFLGFIDQASVLSGIYLFLGLTFSLLFTDFLIIKIPKLKIRSVDSNLNFFLILVCLFTHIYKISSGKFFALSYVGERGILDLIFFNISNIFYLGFYLSLLVYNNSKNFKNLIIIFLYLFIAITSILLSTSKAPILILLFTYIFFISTNNLKINYTYIIIAIFLLFASFIYSYYSRYYFDVYSSGADFSSIITQIFNDPNINYQKFLINPLITRFEQLENLCVVIARREDINLNYYSFGSIVEIVNLIPRILWTERPFLNFNYFVTNEIYRSNIYWSSSIGRFGEAFLISGIFSVFSLIFYLIFYKSVVKFITIFFREPLHKLLCFFLFMRFYIWQDDYFAQSLFTFIFCLVFLKIIITFFEKNYSN